MKPFVEKLSATGSKKFSKREKLETLQVNLGDLCNQACTHCHIEASPQGKKIMTMETARAVLDFIKKKPGLILDITGGAPEMNPNFRYLVTGARPYVKEIMVRCNLTILLEPGHEDLALFFKDNGIHVISSLPCYSKDNVDKQRGRGVYDKSIEALKLLNKIGYGKAPELKLDLIFNPVGPYLPPPQEKLEKDYKRELKKIDDIEFNNLMTITNSPIKRFRRDLEKNGTYESYLKLLEDNFNVNVVEKVMCRTLLSVGWEGTLYDCDFNLALDMGMKDKNGNIMNIKTASHEDVINRGIWFANHCYSCTAGAGSSCQGAIKSVKVSENQRGKGGEMEKTRKIVQNYYGEVLSSSADLKTSACCSLESAPAYLREVSALIDEKIIEKFYGCGSPVPLEIHSRNVLDLGCGTGKDSYVISYLAGEKGRVVGVDMTDNQLKVAKEHIDKQMKRFGFKEPNISFLKGYIEDLKSMGLEDGEFDIVVSNCVVNLSSRKDRVIKEVYRVLREGGEFYFSDVFVDRRLPEWAKKDPVLLGECLGGALYWKDFERLAVEAGFNDPRVYSKSPITISDKSVKEKLGDAEFMSVTYRLFKLPALEDACEDYGQKAMYLGGMKYADNLFKLDDHHVFEKDKLYHVCGNTADMLSMTRFGKYFEIIGEKKVHKGLFEGCGTTPFISDQFNRCEPAPGNTCC